MILLTILPSQEQQHLTLMTLLSILPSSWEYQNAMCIRIGVLKRLILYDPNAQNLRLVIVD